MSVIRPWPEDDDAVDDGRLSWGETFRTALTILALSVLAVLVTAFVAWAWPNQGGRSSVAPSAPSAPSASGPEQPNTDAAFRRDFLWIPGFRPPADAEWPTIEAQAHYMCEDFARGLTHAEVVAKVNPGLTPEQANGLVNASLAAYCPQYEGR